MPDVVVIEIFKHFDQDVKFLIKNVAVTCKRFHTFIHNSSVLWKNITFDHVIHFNDEDSAF